MPKSYQLGFRKRKGELTSIYAEKAAHAIVAASPSHFTHQTNKRGAEFLSLTPDLQLRTGLAKEVSDYAAEFSLTENEWIFQLTDTHSTSDPIKYEIQIIPPQKIGPESTARIATTLISRSSKQNSLLALWKLYELLVQQHLFKDDLVQLFGYYQYKLAYSIRMDILDDSQLSSTFWHTVKMVTSGYGVGTIMPISQLRYLYELSSDEELFSCLTEMKNNGYEIRSNNTNKQIHKGMILIPYSFPTLNERSLQRLTRL